MEQLITPETCSMANEPLATTIVNSEGKVLTYDLLKIEARVKKQMRIMYGIHPDSSDDDTLGRSYLGSKLVGILDALSKITYVDGITTKQIDVEISTYLAGRVIEHQDFDKLAVRILATRLYHEVDKLGSHYTRMSHLIQPEVWTAMQDLKTVIQSEIVFNSNENVFLSTIHDRFDYYGISTLIGIYLTKAEGVVIETPDELYIRVAAALGRNAYSNSDKQVYNLYTELTSKHISLASPVLFSAGMKAGSMISCTLQSTEDSKTGMINSISDIADSSSDASGIGLYVGRVRSCNTHIKGGGKAMGVKRYAKIINELAKGFDQKGKRKGSIALYNDVFHADILDFLKLKMPAGDENDRARDIFLGVLIPDNFYTALLNNEDYYLFCPKVLKDNRIELHKHSGSEFERLYKFAVSRNLGKAVPAKTIWQAILSSLLESGMPYIINIDRVNKSSNHSHYGKVVSSNLCAEIVQYHDENTTANCSLGAVCVDEGLNLYVNFKEAYWNRIKNSVKTLVYSLNNVIQQNKYSTARAKKGGLEQKAIAIGMVGFADALVQLNMAYDSPEAVKFGRELQARIYYYAIEASCEYSQAYRKYNDGLRVTYRSEGDDSVYSGFEQSNYAKGMLEFDHFDYTPVDLDWDALRAKMTQGMYNSLLIANMPTASTSFLLGKVECFEPFTNNIYERENLVGKFVTMNKHLNKILSYIKSESDRKAFVYEMISQGGSVQNIDWTGFGFTKLQEENYKPLFKTVWEISQKAVIEHAAARQYYVDQSQSMNLFLKDPDLSKLSSMLVASYKANLKTGVYYLRTKAATETNKSLGLQRSVVRGASSNSNDITCIGCTV